jgi:protoheme IX farnesyltransferase
MERTRERPLPRGRIAPEDALAFGVIMAAGAVMMMGVAVNWVAAALLAMTVLFYVFVYTIWLKRRTPQNIVIGGAAGAFPPMIGWAAVTGSVSIQSIALFALIFMWTPPHFWALSLYRCRDYAAAGVPMLPVVAGKTETKRHMLIYTALLVPIGMAPAILGIAGWIYGTVAFVLGLVFVAAAVAVWRDETDRSAKRMFGFSIFYLFALFALLIADHAIGVVA